MKPKEIPIIYKGKQIYRMEKCYGFKQAIYDKFWRLYNIHKIYHPMTPTERIVIE